MNDFELKNINKTVCIFAHPDDESFGPSGTISKLTSKGEVYVICVTDGGAGENPSNAVDLARVRKQELENASKILGVKQTFFLNYKDGELKNNIYHKVAGDLEKIILQIKPDSLMTFEPMGVSGHIDHIFCTMVTNFVFLKTKFINTVLYFCNSAAFSKAFKNYFIYFPPGYEKKDVDLTVDISIEWSNKVKAIECHKSQIKDATFLLGQLKSFPKEEYFLVAKK